VNAAHSAQVDAPPVAYAWAPHTPQLLAPVLALNWPATQLTHWVPPVVSLYVPTLQAVHASLPAAETVPAAQEAHEKTTENNPASHTLQLLCPAVFWNVPEEHMEHEAAEPAAYEPFSQLAQAPAPSVDLYEPALQLRQVEEPVES
jgi:hypothetical protein